MLIYYQYCAITVAASDICLRLPTGLFLGGAPLNVSVALHQLGAEVDFVTRVGTDQLGDEILRRLASRGVGCGLVQQDPSHPTGFVKVRQNKL